MVTLTADEDNDLSNGYSVACSRSLPGPGARRLELRAPGRELDGLACSWATSTYLKKTSVPSWTPLAAPVPTP